MGEKLKKHQYINLIADNKQLNTITNYIILAFFLFAPFSVSGVFKAITSPIPTSVAITMLAAGFVSIYLLSDILLNRKIHLRKMDYIILIGFFLPAFLSLFGLVSNIMTLLSHEYMLYVKSEFVSRFINIIVFLFLFIGIKNYLSKKSDMELFKYIKAYSIGISILVLVGIWQFLHFTLGLPFPDLGTRSFIHGISDDTHLLFRRRLTSFANEPSFLAPFLIDGMIIGFMVFHQNIKKYFLYIFLPVAFVLFFSFSSGGYFNFLLLAGILVVVLMFSKVNVLRIFKSKGFLIASVLFVLLIVIGWDYVQILTKPVFGRFETFFDINSHARLYMVIMPFVWIFDHSPLSVIFGNGPASYSFLQTSKFLPTGYRVHITSNNYFVDILFEYGFLGLILALWMFAYIAFKFLRKINEHKFYIVGLLLIIHLGISSMYRADFTSPRFWSVLIIVTIIFQLANRYSKKPE